MGDGMGLGKAARAEFSAGGYGYALAGAGVAIIEYSFGGDGVTALLSLLLAIACLAVAKSLHRAPPLLVKVFVFTGTLFLMTGAGWTVKTEVENARFKSAADADANMVALSIRGEAMDKEYASDPSDRAIHRREVIAWHDSVRTAVLNGFGLSMQYEYDNCVGADWANWTTHAQLRTAIGCLNTIAREGKAERKQPHE